EVRTDAVQNLVAAIHIAGYKAVDLPCIPEVVLCFADKVLRGCRVTKISTHDWAGFDSPNFPPLGTIGEHIKINTKLIWEGPKEGKDFFINEEIATEVMRKIEVLELGLFPGFKASQLKTILGLPNVKGVVLRTFGNGNAPGNPQFLQVIDDAINGPDPCTILSVTKCPKGMVEMGMYAASIALLERGVISGLDMTGEAAMAKLFWTLGTQTGPGIAAQLQINQRGEQSENLFDLHYGTGGSKDEPVDRFTGSIAPDSRLLRPKLSRSVVRLSGAGFSGIEYGHVARVRIFMNHPDASSTTPADDPRCVAEFIHLWEGEPATLIQDITEKTTAVMDQGNISLTVVPLDGVKVWFKGLYLALFSEAAF
ncbi:MAG: asparaginase, partial [Fidelibacterota bacterium]